RLGFVLDKAAALDAGLVLAGRQISEHGSICEQTRGEQRLVRNDYHQLRLDFTEADRAGRHLSVVFRVFDDGVAFRYELPALKNLKPWKISAELTEFV
ncbi:glycoside hydrolase family 97 N-terminal domain-containing protein, partial [Citrobacter braakii]|uniref:glycoside hydrolase family 97 N-terminal domain-containing protein n=1 Tax=Citrobacter braakii TaxID=57706 RepID=UPI00197FEAFC